MIDEARVDVDGGYGEDGSKVKAFLILEGDFSNECEKYLEDDTALSIIFEISRGTAVELYKALEAII